ncbi:MAG: sulfoxide reductase heme-binding subunit YedZ [Luminiphilus sp.]|nr:sulfoxide reductase heme-binding subunit YedZ [Luminiphilus sp.]MDG1461470.1 sulfoxide reductase heme-binding subunit YedZ [Luminiphilus sp.]
MGVPLYRLPWADRLWWVLVFALALTPFMLIIYGVLGNTLGPDPAEALMHQTGEWAIRLLVLVLAARPLAQWGWPALFRYRRMLGLFMFFYTTLHLLVFAQVYVGWNPAILLEELIERPYVLVGFGGWALLIPLAVTSTDRMRRKLRQRWRQLHQLVYAVAVLGVLHVLWLSRSDIGDAVLYGLLLGTLLFWRAALVLRRRLAPRR